MKKKGEPDFLRMFCCNGWDWNRYDGWADDEFNKYTATFLSHAYSVKVQAVVASSWRGIQLDGHLGVLCLEAVGYPDCDRDENNGYSFGDLEDIIGGLIRAEENLVRIGVPFTKDYKFHGKNRANMKRKNDALRKKLNMEKWEEEAWNQFENRGK